MSPLKRQENLWFFLPPLFALLALAGVHLAGVNRDLFLFFNGWSAFGGDALWAHITVFGDGAMVLALLLPWWKKRPELVWAAVIAALFSTTWTHSLKPFFDAPRPPAVLDPASFHVIGSAIRNHSFPSGHSTGIFTFLGIMALLAVPAGLRWTTAARCGLIGLAALVAISRSVVGVHWPIDLLGGMFGGWLSAVGGILLMRRFPVAARPVPRAIALLIPAIAAGMLLFGYGTGYTAPALMQQVVGGVCLLMWIISLRPGSAFQARQVRQ